MQGNDARAGYPWGRGAALGLKCLLRMQESRV